MTISPSITERSGRLAFTASTTSGKYLVIGRSLRLPISTSSPSRKMIDRKPSHLGSYDAPGGISATALASIGGKGVITGSCMSSLWPQAGHGSSRYRANVLSAKFRPAAVLVALGLLVACTTTTTGDGSGAGRVTPPSRPTASASGSHSAAPLEFNDCSRLLDLGGVS